MRNFLNSVGDYFDNFLPNLDKENLSCMLATMIFLVLGLLSLLVLCFSPPEHKANCIWFALAAFFFFLISERTRKKI